MLRELLQKADKEHYAIGAFNFHSMTEFQAIIDAAYEEKSPVIVMPKFETVEVMNSKGIRYIESIVKAAREELQNIPIILHLDHGAVYCKDKAGKKYLDCETTYNKMEECIKSGFDSIMFDGSTLPIEENIKWTKKVVERAHKEKVCVEGEVGIIPKAAEKKGKIDFSDPKEVKKFVESTSVDAVAPAIGTEHAASEECEINFSLLNEINELIKTPLVLHGGTCVSDSDWRKAIRLGINKGNIGTSIKKIFTKTLRCELINNTTEIDPRKYLPPARDAVKKHVKDKMRLLGSAGKAEEKG